MGTEATLTASPEALSARAAANSRVNELEQIMSQFPPVECPLNHTFTPGLYMREIFMPAGTLVTSKIHKTEHPFIISKGVVSVWIEGEGVKTFHAPHSGVTKPGTRRVLYVHEDCVWATFHPTTEKDLEKIEAQLIFPHDIPAQLSAPVLAQLMEAPHVQG